MVYVWPYAYCHEQSIINQGNIYSLSTKCGTTQAQQKPAILSGQQGRYSNRKNPAKPIVFKTDDNTLVEV